MEKVNNSIIYYSLFGFYNNIYIYTYFLPSPDTMPIMSESNVIYYKNQKKIAINWGCQYINIYIYY